MSIVKISRKCHNYFITRRELEVSTSLLATKLYFPPARPKLVPRPRLVERLNAGLRKPLTLISAPAGFGKTSLMSEWRMGNESRLPAAWLSLDEGDNDPSRFWSYLIASLETFQHNSFDTTRGLLQSPQPVPPETIASSIVHELESFPNDHVLVLDDLHVITSHIIQHALAFLLDHLPSKSHLVILTRADPSLPLSRLRVRDQLTELRAADLRFTLNEVTAFLSRTMGLSLTPEQIVSLEARTEGWIAGLQLAALSMQGRGDIEDFVAAFSGSHHYVVDYLIEEVLSLQSEKMRDFLLKTSILERMNSSLCNALTGCTDGQPMLEKLEQSNLFVVGLDTERQWYRYHHLFADVLQQHLMQSNPDGARELHRRAAQWYDGAGLFEDAVHHALNAADHDFAARLIANIVRKTWEQENVAVTLGWLNRLPKQLVFSHPVLLIDYAWVLAFSGQFDEVEPVLQFLEKSVLGEGPIAEGESALSLLDSPLPVLSQTVGGAPTRARLPVIIDLVRTFVERFRDPRKAQMYCERALQQIQPEDQHNYATVLFFRGHIHLLNGESSQAEHTLLEAYREGRRLNIHSVYLSAVNCLAHLLILQARLHEAMALLTETSRYVQAQPEPILAGIERIRMGDIQREWNALPHSLENVLAGLRLAESGGDFVFVRDGYIAQARVEQSQGNLDGAATLLMKALQVSPQAERSLGVMPMDALWARLCLARGNLPEAEEWLSRIRFCPEDEPVFAQEFNLLTLARIQLAQERFEDTCRLLKRLIPVAESAGRFGRVIEMLILQALAWQAKGEVSNALPLLARALSLAEPGGYIRVFLDEGAPMAKLLYHARSRQIAPKYVARLLSEFDKKPTVIPATKQPLIEMLSERELEILRLVAGGKSNQEIAAELYLAVGTVKKHISNIFGKLNVESRTRCIAQARQLHLIE